MASLNVLRMICLCLVVLLGSSVTACAEGRHALVVGIDTYENVPSLEKAVNDARAVKAALTTAGFSVQLVEGPDQIGFLEAIASFSASIGPGDEAVVYYAGHGVEIDGRNYLLPSDVPSAAAGQEIVLTNRSISVQDLVDALQSRGARISLLILDACRDNPFPRSGTRSIGGTRGLAPAPKAEGTFILYSAGEGETALDRLSNGDPNPNSVFTRALVPLISEPGLPLREVSRRVRSDVRQMALSVDHAQFPAVYDQLDGDFSFTVAGVAAAVVAADPCSAARADWWSVRDSKDEKAIQRFLAAYPDCPLLQSLGQMQLDEARESVSLKFQESEEVWAQIFETQVGLPYKNAKFVRYTGVLQSPCGELSGMSGPLYCPLDGQTYFSEEYKSLVELRLGRTGIFAAEYLMALESAHHVQNQLGILVKFEKITATLPVAEKNALSLRLELQAHCITGLWVRKPLLEASGIDPSNIEEVVVDILDFSDELIQRNVKTEMLPYFRSTATIDQKVNWFKIGLLSGKLTDCDTFTAQNP